MISSFGPTDQYDSDKIVPLGYFVLLEWSEVVNDGLLAMVVLLREENLSLQLYMQHSGDTKDI